MQIQTVSPPKRSKGRSSKKAKAKGKAKKASMADKADRHALYERAVQDPKTDAATLAKLYKMFPA